MLALLFGVVGKLLLLLDRGADFERGVPIAAAGCQVAFAGINFSGATTTTADSTPRFGIDADDDGAGGIMVGGGSGAGAGGSVVGSGGGGGGGADDGGADGFNERSIGGVAFAYSIGIWSRVSWLVISRTASS